MPSICGRVSAESGRIEIEIWRGLPSRVFRLARWRWTLARASSTLHGGRLLTHGLQYQSLLRQRTEAPCQPLLPEWPAYSTAALSSVPLVSSLCSSSPSSSTCAPSSARQASHPAALCEIHTTMRTGYPFLPLLALLIRPVSANFLLADTYIGRDFLQSWTWETFDDPTHGRVNYIDQPTALASNLTFASDDKFVMRADFQNVVQPPARGRNSIRIRSNKAYDEAVVVLDLQHMPEGCSTWPAFWSLSQQGPWPNGGEIDIIEGVNMNTANLASLHTTPNCMMPPAGPPNRFMSGNVTSSNCDANVNFNQGCGVQFSTPASYGSDFNAAGGGYFVLVRSRTSNPGVSIWFWSRNDDRVPLEVRSPPPNPPTAAGLVAPAAMYPTAWWGEPDAVFPLCDNCDYASHFDAHNFVFDLTFCGDWAGTAYSTSGCPGDCNDHVDNNPQDFLDAYWEINSLRIYSPAN